MPSSARHRGIESIYHQGNFEISTNISFSKNLRSIWSLHHVLMRDMQRSIYFFEMCNYYTTKFRFRQLPASALRLRFTLLKPPHATPTTNERASPT